MGVMGAMSLAHSSFGRRNLLVQSSAFSGLRDPPTMTFSIVFCESGVWVMCECGEIATQPNDVFVATLTREVASCAQVTPVGRRASQIWSQPTT